jgi:UDP-N-acetylglucosamine 2-epimerase (non-hydrolysing)
MSAAVSLVGGARPNFMKLAPLYRALRACRCFDVRLVHTGQHYDEQMSGAFFRELGLPTPDATLNVGSGTHAVQTARLLERFDDHLRESRPDLVVVVGDVNSTLACALAAVKTRYDDGRRPLIAHVEAGLRSFDRSMPEEINRILTDAIADYLFVTEPAGVDNLGREGCDANKVFLVGNVMIDTLLARAEDARRASPWTLFGLKPQGYAVATLHRPSNVDDEEQLAQLWYSLSAASWRLPVVFPLHPRTRARVEAARLDAPPHLHLCDPQPYMTFLGLLAGSRVVLTDSGGIQEETTMLGVPCLTLRANTERPITVALGTNRVVGTDVTRVVPELDQVLATPMPETRDLPLWDGLAAERIAEILEHEVAAGRIGSDHIAPVAHVR